MGAPASPRAHCCARVAQIAHDACWLAGQDASPEWNAWVDRSVASLMGVGHDARLGFRSGLVTGEQHAGAVCTTLRGVKI